MHIFFNFVDAKEVENKLRLIAFQVEAAMKDRRSGDIKSSGMDLKRIDSTGTVLRNFGLIQAQVETQRAAIYTGKHMM